MSKRKGRSLWDDVKTSVKKPFESWQKKPKMPSPEQRGASSTSGTVASGVAGCSGASQQAHHDQVTFNGNGEPPQLSTNLPSMSEIRLVTKDPQLPVDILLLTVEKCEFLACYKELKDPYRCYFDGLGYVYFEDINESQEEKVKVALLRCYKGGIGPGGSLISIKNAVTLLRPKAVISVGTCSGLNPEKTKLGDVVVSAMLTTCASKVVTSNGEQSTGMSGYVSKRFLDVIKNCADGWQAPLKNLEAQEVEVHCGEFLSSPEQVSAKWRRNQLVKLHPRAIAMEMEGEGVFTAAFDSEIQWLIVKGIADYADGTPLTGESWSPCASVMAASVVAHILSDPGVFRSWPHYKAFPAPTPFDLKRYQARLHTFYNTMSQVRITPWNPDDTVHIDDVYTNLSWLRDHKTPRGTSQEKLKDYSEIFGGTKRFPMPKRILIYGKPGIGKSTFSQKIAFDWAAGRKEILKKFNVLLMVKLRDVCGLQDIGAVLKASKLLAADDTISADSLHDYIHQNQEQVLLVLDGYDEYSAGVSSPVDQIWKGDILRDCHVIMTTRPTEADKVRKSSDVQLQIRGFDSEEQVKEFASKYLTDPAEVEMLVVYLRENKISDLAAIPLLLLMMCLVWRDRHHRGFPKSRLGLYERFVETLLYQMAVKDSDKGIESNILESYKEELTRIGKLALDALLQGTLHFPLRQLHSQNSVLSKTMIRTGIFQISKLSSAVPDESVFFIHKSIQEFLAAWFIMHEAGLQDGKIDCLLSIDSLLKVSMVQEILIFMCQWSEEGTKAVFSLLQLVGEKQGLTKYNFTEVPAIEDMSRDQRDFCTTCLNYFQSCSVSHRQAVYPSFLNCVHGVVVVSEDQRSSLARNHVLKSLKPCLLFFTARVKMISEDVESELDDLLSRLHNANEDVESEDEDIESEDDDVLSIMHNANEDVESEDEDVESEVDDPLSRLHNANKDVESEDDDVFSITHNANKSVEIVDDDVLSIMRDLETVVVTCYGDKKSLNNCSNLTVNDFFLKKEGQQIVLYLTVIRKCPALYVKPELAHKESKGLVPVEECHYNFIRAQAPALPVKLLSEITSISALESPHQKPADHISQNQDASSLHLTEKTYDPTRKHSLRGFVHSHANKTYLHVNENLFSYERFRTKPRFDREAKGNSEMAYCIRKSQYV